MRRYSSKRLIVIAVYFLFAMLLSLFLIYSQSEYRMRQIIKYRRESLENEMTKSYSAFFGEGIQLVDLLVNELDIFFDITAYQTSNNHVESVKESLLPFMKNIIKDKNIYSFYICFNPALTNRPNDIWLIDKDYEFNFKRLNQIPVDYFEESSLDKEWYFKAINSKEGIWTEPHYKDKLNREELFFSYNQSFYKEGLLIGVVGVEFSSNNLKNIKDNIFLNDDCDIWVADNKGQRVYDSLNSGTQFSDGAIGSFNKKNNRLIKVIQLDNDWLLGISIYDSMMKTYVTSMKYNLISMIILSIVFIVGTVFFVFKKISVPLERLTNEVELIESGTYDGNISGDILNQKNNIGHLALSIFNMVESKKNTYEELGKQKDEIIQLYEESYAINENLETTLFQKEQLYDDLNIMFKKLEDANRKLENRVNERTEELNEKNKDLEGALEENKKNNNNLRRLNNDLQKTIKELKLAQDRLIESEKMVALGNMVSGIAHEINTPLGVSLTATSYVLDHIREIGTEISTLSDESLAELMGEIEESSQIIYDSLKKSIKLMTSFKEVAVNQHSNEKLLFDLLEYTHTVIHSLRHEYIQVVEKLDIDIPADLEVYQYPGAYSQVLTNLVINSVKHGFIGRNDGHIFIQAFKRNNKVYLIYKDDGLGIKKAHLKKIFEPFFTTKRANGGTGLGLSIVYNLVHNSLNGKIECFSQVGKGTEFNISFPVMVEEATVKE